MASDHRTYQKGLWAEMAAFLYLWLRGYRLRAWRYRAPGGEVDLVVTRGRTLVFAEVKYRPTLDQGVGAIPPAAYRRLRAAATHYLAHNQRFSGHDVRFDLLAVAPPWSIRHLDNIDLSSA